MALVILLVFFIEVILFLISLNVAIDYKRGYVIRVLVMILRLWKISPEKHHRLFAEPDSMFQEAIF